jgi:hypothetical protein
VTAAQGLGESQPIHVGEIVVQERDRYVGAAPEGLRGVGRHHHRVATLLQPLRGGPTHELVVIDHEHRLSI